MAELNEQQLSDEDKKRVWDIWAKVFEASNRVILQHQKFGFQGVAKLEDPDVEGMVMQLKVFGAIIDILVSAMPYDEQRILLNAKRQITNMELLALALLANNQEGYQSAITALDGQAVF